MLENHIWVEHEDLVFVKKLEQECLTWKGTPYSEGSRIPKFGVDCINFVSSVLDSILNITLPPDPAILSDVALNNPEKARDCMKYMVNRYRPYTEVKDKTIKPGDVIITRVENSGPVHALIAGFNKNTIWHIPSQKSSVCRTGLLIPGLTLDKIYRKI